MKIQMKIYIVKINKNILKIFFKVQKNYDFKFDKLYI